MIGILDYGVGNLTSLKNFFNRMGYQACLVTTKESIMAVDLLILPGVGLFETAMAALDKSGTLEALQDRFAIKRPIMGICLGMQVMFETSQESPGIRGLGWFKGDVIKLETKGTNLPLPHMGWNTLKANPQHKWLSFADSKDVYYVHSYVASPEDPSMVLATSTYGDYFPAIVANLEANLIGMQFHPEKSGHAGQEVVKACLDQLKIPKQIQRYAAMDLLDGQVVRLKQGQYDQRTVFGEPENFADQLSRMNFDGLHLINLNGAKGEPLRNLEIICRLAANYPLKIQVGGGIRNWQDAERLLFLNCDVIVSTWFFEDYESFARLSHAYPGKVSLSLDFKDGKLMTRGWLKAEDMTLESILMRIGALPLASLVITDIASDGMGNGIRTSFFQDIASRILQICPDVTLTAAGGMPLDIPSLIPLVAIGYQRCVIGLSLYESLTKGAATC